MSAYRPAKPPLRLDDVEQQLEREGVDLDHLRPSASRGAAAARPRRARPGCRRVRTAYRNSPRSVVRTRAAVRTDRDTARSVRNRSICTGDTDEIGSLPKAGTMWTRSALSSDSHARTDT